MSSAFFGNVGRQNVGVGIRRRPAFVGFVRLASSRLGFLKNDSGIEVKLREYAVLLVSTRLLGWVVNVVICSCFLRCSANLHNYAAKSGGIGLNGG